MEASGPRNGLVDRRITREAHPEAAVPAELLAATGRGSADALRRLYELESPRLYGIALRIVRRPEVAADVLQEAFVQIWQNAGRFATERGAGAAWLTGIVRYRALDAVRRLGREILSDDPALGDRAEEPDILEHLDASLLRGLVLRAVATGGAPSDRDFELWAIAPGAAHAQPLGIVPASGRLALGVLPEAVRDGATLAISIEPRGGSPTGRPTGPVVFAGTLIAAR